MTYDPNNPSLILKPAPNYDTLGRISPYIHCHFTEIIIRGKSTDSPFPTDPKTGDHWYDIATDKTWVYITITYDQYSRSLWVEDRP